MIPKIIHQIFFNIQEKELEEFEIFEKSIESLKNTNKDYEYILWNEKSSRDLLKENFPEYLSFYDNLRFPIQRIDFIRFVILYVYGGFYVDLDMIAIKNFDPLIKNKIIFHNIKDVKPIYSFIENDFIGSEKNLNLWKGAMEECLLNYKEKLKIKIYEKWKGRFILQTTGPRFLSRYIRENYPEHKPINLVYSKWHNGEEKNYYLKDYKLNTWVGK